MNIIEAMKREQNYKLTENGAIALKSTLDRSLDFFATMGAMRNRSDEDIIRGFMDVFAEDEKTALKMLFYLRDIRGGLGERRAFRTICRYLADNQTEAMRRNLIYIPTYGRWDDLYVFVGTKLEEFAFSLMKNQFFEDCFSMYEEREVSLLAKWLKSANSKNAETRRLGLLTARYFRISEPVYRKTLASLRRYIDVTEVKMSNNEWGEIKYENVPSVCHNRNRNAFVKHDDERYSAFLKAVEKGESKINAATLFPYDIVGKYMKDCGWHVSVHNTDATLEAQWKALPNYISEDKNYLIMADVSGSMTGRPMETSVGLGLYFAERNHGAFANYFMTFSSRPELVYFNPKLSLRDRVGSALEADWGGSTNLEAAFELLLVSAVKNNVLAEEMPDALIVITDMEIDDHYMRLGGFNTSFTSEMKRRFERVGYKMPTIVWWNVNARANTFHAEATDDVRFVSGSSASVFKDLCDNLGSSPRDLMLQILYSERYGCIK